MGALGTGIYSNDIAKEFIQYVVKLMIKEANESEEYLVAIDYIIKTNTILQRRDSKILFEVLENELKEETLNNWRESCIEDRKNLLLKLKDDLSKLIIDDIEEVSPLYLTKVSKGILWDTIDNFVKSHYEVSKDDVYNMATYLLVFGKSEKESFLNEFDSIKREYIKALDCEQINEMYDDIDKEYVTELLILQGYELYNNFEMFGSRIIIDQAIDNRNSGKYGDYLSDGRLMDKIKLFSNRFK